MPSLICQMNEAEYEAMVQRLYGWASHLFRAPSDDATILAAAREYFNRGREEGFTTGELVDFLGISSPSVLSRAGWSEDDELRIMQLISKSEAGS